MARAGCWRAVERVSRGGADRTTAWWRTLIVRHIAFMLSFEHAGFDIQLRDEPTYILRSADNARRYDREIQLCDGRDFYSRHGVVVSTAGVARSAILLGCGGSTLVHERSAVAADDMLYVACGDSVCALRLPDLLPAWVARVDSATCYGVYLLPDGAGLISHGELTIARLSLDGRLMWSSKRRAIFTGDFTVLNDRARAVDWEGATFEFALADGRSLPVSA